MMCEFCKNITNEVDEDLSNRHGGFALVRDKDDNPCIVQEFVDDYGEMACLVSESIRFCPMCGECIEDGMTDSEIVAKILEEVERDRRLKNGTK